MGNFGVPLRGIYLELVRYSSEEYTHLGPDVFVTWRTDEGKADQKNIGLGV